MKLSQKRIDSFQNQIYIFYRQNKRLLKWREEIKPYWVVVSEVMLQQTQVSRVEQKFPEFIAKFPTFESLAQATLEQVLTVWQGMGYNRRGKYLQEIARIVVHQYQSVVPEDPETLDKLPGIGPATARSISTFIYNRPELFIETNIRRVYIHHFFGDREDISDTEITPLLKQTIDYQHPREWYYALMDYGTYLGKTLPNPNRRSRHYAKQSKFEGSKRQIRGAVLRSILTNGPQSDAELLRGLGFEKTQLYTVLQEMSREGMVSEKDGKYKITS